MDESHQDTTESKLTATENKLLLPPLSADAQKRLKRLHKKPFAERMVAGKTSWDWIQLALQIVGALAVLLTLISLMVNVQQFKEQQRSENDRTIQQQRNEQLRAIDQQQQTTLETYLDRMSDLLLTQHLDKSQQGAEVRQVARARTLTALQNLNPARKGILLHFLYESKLIGYYDTPDDSLHLQIINLSSADLHCADLHYADLNDANLRGAILTGAILTGADLRHVDLSGANLSGAILSGAILTGANLNDANLSGADLRDAFLWDTNLHYADLSGANLQSDAFLLNVDLSEAFLRGANLSGADLSDDNLYYADLNDANLRGAILTGAILTGAILTGANLYRADLSGADLSGAFLSGAFLSGAFLSGAFLSGAFLDKTILKRAQYNTKEILMKNEQGKILGKISPTLWPQGFNPKATGAIEDNTGYHT